MLKKVTAVLVPLFGFLFITAYIRSATVDVVYTDYMRLVCSYLADPVSLSPYLQADALTRMPVTYLERLINVGIFGYSTWFDMFLSAAFLAAASGIIALYGLKKGLGSGWLLALMFVVFSLDKWEMLTNGSGQVHFLTFVLFYETYVIYDRLKTMPGAKKRDAAALIWLPAATIILAAGPYCVAYVGAMLIMYLWDTLDEKGVFERRKASGKAAGYAGCESFRIRPVHAAALVVPLILYLLSRSASYEAYSGATDAGLIETLIDVPGFFVSMFVKSFASMIIGGETAAEYGIPGAILFILGLIVMAGYAVAIYLNIRTGLIRRAKVPMLLILSGLLSHGLVLASRWIFLNDMYGMSSRYALQFQSGILGILLTFGLLEAERKTAESRKRKEGEKAGKAGSGGNAAPLRDIETGSGIRARASVQGIPVWIRYFCAALTVLILAGHMATNGREIGIAKYRKENFEAMREAALTYEELDDAELKRIFQYHDPEGTREALDILKANGWNVFGE